MEHEFYVGYLDPAPPGLSRFARRAAALLLGLTTLLGFGFSASQPTFAAARFDFGAPRSFEGELLLFPQPMLQVQRPGESAGSDSMYYLVNPGKFGARDAVAAYEGHRVRLTGTPIYRGDQTMLELDPSSVQDLGQSTSPPPQAQDLGEFTLHGEIVDSKCFLGVMNPGNLKPHRDCATRCISGGIPPILMVRDASGSTRHLLLLGEQGQQINEEVLEYVAEPVRVSGQVQRLGERWVMKINPDEIQRI